jgi:hypothetical protein
MLDVVVANELMLSPDSVVVPVDEILNGVKLEVVANVVGEAVAI